MDLDLEAQRQSDGHHPRMHADPPGETASTISSHNTASSSRRYEQFDGLVATQVEVVVEEPAPAASMMDAQVLETVGGDMVSTCSSPRIAEATDITSKVNRDDPDHFTIDAKNTVGSLEHVVAARRNNAAARRRLADDETNSSNKVNEDDPNHFTIDAKNTVGSLEHVVAARRNNAAAAAAAAANSSKRDTARPLPLPTLQEPTESSLGPFSPSSTGKNHEADPTGVVKGVSKKQPISTTPISKRKVGAAAFILLVVVAVAIIAAVISQNENNEEDSVLISQEDKESDPPSTTRPSTSATPSPTPTHVPVDSTLDNGVSTASPNPGSSSTAVPTDGENQKLLASDGSANDEFGYSVDASRSTLIVGAPFDDDNGAESGSAYVYTRLLADSFTEQAKLTPSSNGTTTNDAWFGISVAIDGDIVVIGAPGAEGTSIVGKVYVFKRFMGTIWTQQETFTSDSPNNRFGRSVAYHNGTAVVGAYKDNNELGSVFVFVSLDSGWTQQAKLVASDGFPSDQFGRSLAVYNNTVLVGAMRHGGDSGSAYVFVRNNGTVWTQQAKLSPQDGTELGFFGASVALDKDERALIAAPGDDRGEGTTLGSAYLFGCNATKSTWYEENKLVLDGNDTGTVFGFSVAFDAYSNAFVSGTYSGDNVNGRGLVRKFPRNSRLSDEEPFFTAVGGGSAFDYFGFSIAASADRLFVGANRDNDNGANSGSVHVLERYSSSLLPGKGFGPGGHYDRGPPADIFG